MTDTDQFFIDYFTGLAAAVKEISHSAQHEAFFVIEDLDNMEEVQEAIRRRLKYPALLLEYFEDDLDDHDTDNTTEILSSAVSVILRVGQGAAVDRRAARLEAKRIARIILFKMKWDAINGPLAEKNIICKIRSKGMPVGPVIENAYGWRYTFTWYAPVQTALNPNDFNP